MIGSFLSRGLLLVLGYVYPAYECYKSVEMNKPDIEQLRFWCQYWILVAGLTVCERIGDMFIGWVPMYGEAKLAFFIYLWFPKTKGTTYVYDSFFRPYVAKHETEIDRSLLELRTRAGDMALLYWQKAASYGQTRIFDVLQYIASQSPRPQRAQPSRQGTRVQKPAAPLNKGPGAPLNQAPGATTQLQDEQPSSPALSDHQEDATDKAGPSGDSKPAPTPAHPPAVPKEQKTAPMQALIETVRISEELEMMQVDLVPSENGSAQSQDMILDGEERVTQARIRKTRAPPDHPNK
ncbi:putative HVA22-like protein g [Primulina huaijiensis]|uniref:putative HVA22-like protein g n=1 Tax=Primulina huaijiensis TaxID=1492673 RepID=UPI003CC72BB5